MPYFLYILLCKNNKLYTGIAVDVEKRFELHKSGKGAKYTQRNKPIKVVYTQKFKTRSMALKREAEIKSMKKQEKEGLVGL
ncbi:MAG TPA: GIY-YIG nuclease family protein [Patescibacteria group bacterium]|nr:GIY-YIG nuclease family protein [Patescibacteria group bacterium]